VWAPALVGWYGGTGWSVSVNAGAPVYGWVPLAWGEPYHPWWGRCSNSCWQRYNRPYAVNVVERPHRPPSTYVNLRVPGAITAVAGTTLAAAKPVASNRIPIQAGSPPPTLTAAPPIRPLPVIAPAVRAGSGGAPAPASTLYQTKPRMTPMPAYSAPARNAPAPAAPTRTAPVTPAPSVAAPAAPATPAPRFVEPRQRQVSQGAPVPAPSASQPMPPPAAPQVEPKPRHVPRQEGVAVPAPAPAPARAAAPPPMPAPPAPAPRAVAPAPAPRAVAPAAASPAPNAAASPQGATRGQGQPAPAAQHEKPKESPRGGPQDAPAR
jgi:hypothetical protein